MKLITAMVRSDKFEAVQTAVTAHDTHVTYLSNVGDMCEPIPAAYRGSSYQQARPRLRIEIVVVNDLAVKDVIAAISEAARIDDPEALSGGGIFVTPLDQWVRIPARHPEPALELEPAGGRSWRAS